MGQFSYEQPREKVLRLGAASLTNVELLQVIIGSGTSGVPVRSLARKINRLLTRRELQWSLDDIQSVKGIGIAKASLLVAAFELASRFVDRGQNQRYRTVNDIYPLILRITPEHTFIVWMYLFDGASRLIGRSDIRHEPGLDSEYFTGHIVREALQQGAVGIYVVFAQKEHTPELTIEELAIIRGIAGVGKFTALTVVGVATVSKRGIKQYKREEL